MMVFLTALVCIYTWPPCPFVFIPMFSPFVMLISFAILSSPCALLEIGSTGSVCRSSKLFGFVSITEDRVELDPGHIGFRDEGLVAASALGWRSFFVPLSLVKWVISEVEKSPAIRRRKPLAIFHGHIHAVIFTVEISSSGWFRARAVGEGGVKNARQFLDEDGA